MSECIISRYIGKGGGGGSFADVVSIYSMSKAVQETGYNSKIIDGILYEFESIVVDSITDDNVDSIFSKVLNRQQYFLLVKAKSIDISKTLIPPYPKKSLIIMCPTITGTGKISMSGKGPNILPENIMLFNDNEVDGINKILIPAYANNAVSAQGSSAVNYVPPAGNNGTGYNCGSGGIGGVIVNSGTGSAVLTSGSGYSYGGGAGSSGTWAGSNVSVSAEYPMQGNTPANTSYYELMGGVGNPPGTHKIGSYVNYDGHSPSPAQNSGVGGRLIVFCDTVSLSLEAKGIDSVECTAFAGACAGGSGGGSINIFYRDSNTAVTDTTGGAGATGDNTGRRGSKGGNGSVTSVLNTGLKFN